MSTQVEHVFVGGTGRSGTHVVAQLLGHHSRLRDVEIEARFHCNPRGFPDLLAERVTVEQFVRKLRRFWWHRIKAGEPLAAVLPSLPLGREERGLYKVVPRDRFDAAVDAFEAAWRGDRVGACRALFDDLLAPLAAEAGKPGLVEMSSDNIAQGPTLLRVFEDAKLIHTVRDGRDAGASKVSKRQKRDHPRDAMQGIEWWQKRLVRVDAAVREIPPKRLYVVSLDELAYGDRESAYAGLLEFLGLDDEPALRRYFDREVSAHKAHPERWREGLEEESQRAVCLRYEEALDELESAGVHCAPALRRAYLQERDGVSA